MPAPRSKQAPAAPPAASKTYKRRVQIAAASYHVEVPGPDGRLVKLQRDAAIGDEVDVSAQEQMRLDSLGVLAPVGATRESIQAEADARLEAYRNARRGVAGVV